MAAIVVDDVSKSFRLQKDRAHSLKELITRRDRQSGADQFWALRNVSFEIPEGSMFALVGPNGSGKSTLLKIMAGIDIAEKRVAVVEQELIGGLIEVTAIVTRVGLGSEHKTKVATKAGGVADFATYLVEVVPSLTLVVHQVVNHTILQATLGPAEQPGRHKLLRVRLVVVELILRGPKAKLIGETRPSQPRHLPPQVEPLVEAKVAPVPRRIERALLTGKQLLVIPAGEEETAIGVPVMLDPSSPSLSAS